MTVPGRWIERQGKLFFATIGNQKSYRALCLRALSRVHQLELRELQFWSVSARVATLPELFLDNGGRRLTFFEPKLRSGFQSKDSAAFLRKGLDAELLYQLPLALSEDFWKAWDEPRGRAREDWTLTFTGEDL